MTSTGSNRQDRAARTMLALRPGSPDLAGGRGASVTLVNKFRGLGGGGEIGGKMAPLDWPNDSPSGSRDSCRVLPARLRCRLLSRRWESYSSHLNRSYGSQIIHHSPSRTFGERPPTDSVRTDAVSVAHDTRRRAQHRLCLRGAAAHPGDGDRQLRETVPNRSDSR